ncbi:MAG: TIM-barrel domain-containing protein, partial [Parabacteroides sp.]
LDGNVENLKSFGDYAREQGVEIGLWTQSDLHPKEGISALLQRDIVKEVRDAGVRVLKTDVAWVGAGYSFGLNGVTDVGEVMPYYGNNARPFIISLDGWAGTQRYAGIWSGDQTGGEWEYIRFHIPTYIGSGLSGQPNISSDMDGIFGGQNAVVNTRDFQWKTWSIMQLNMDGWGRNEKYPHALGEPATSINRLYLKLKSELLPYAYTYAHEAVDGKPLIRAIFLDDPNDYTLGVATRYEYLFGPDFLVAPIYQATEADAEGNDIRDGIYLPAGQWIDYFNGDLYEGGRVINNFPAPLWKLPVFVRNGAIIPMTNPNNHVSEINNQLRIYELYPYGHSEMTEYDDDGLTEAYKSGQAVRTRIESDLTGDQLTVKLHGTEGDFEGFVAEKTTELRINATARPKTVSAMIGTQRIKLTEADSLSQFEQGENLYYYEEAPQLNRFSTPDSPFEQVKIVKNPQLRVKLAKTDIRKQVVTVTVKGFAFKPTDKTRVKHGALTAPTATILPENTEAYTLRPTWNRVDNADYYEIELNDMCFSTIRNTQLLFENLAAETDYTFKIRSVNADGVSDWASFGARTKNNPLEFAIPNLKGEVTAPSQEGFEVFRLFDFAESGDTWHSEYGKKAVPFELTIDLRTINTLDKFHYLGRLDGGNGLLLKGSVAYSLDKEHWTEAGDFEWQRNGDVNVFTFADQPTARYIKLSVTEAVGNYGSGRELYVFKVPGTESYLPGDINADGKIDHNDLTSYINYTGLRRGDSDFEGYISIGDINHNDLIDAYDISVVTTQLEDGIDGTVESSPVSGRLEATYDKNSYQAGNTVCLSVKGIDLQSVNALSGSITYNQQQLEFLSVEPRNLLKLENLTYDRLHTNGTKALYPTFVNIGEKPTLEGNDELFIIRFKAKQNVRQLPKLEDLLLIDKNLNVCK